MVLSASRHVDRLTWSERSSEERSSRRDWPRLQELAWGYVCDAAATRHVPSPRREI